MVDTTVLLSLEKQTSIRYLYLGKILSAYRDLEQECILTAFSMNPTRECFQLVCALAEKSSANEASNVENFTVQNEKIDALPTIMRPDALLNSKDYDALRAPNHLLDSLTTISEGVRSDLVCLLCVPRIKNLNWVVSWPELKMSCEELLQTEKKKQIVENTTASSNDNLKYINLNYDDFKDFTPHEYPGIEKGYEIYVADSDSEESFPIGNGGGGGNDNESDGTDTAPESKQYIVKEKKRLQDRKRRLMRRSKKLLEENESELNLNNDPNQTKKKRKLPRMNTDCLKMRRAPRKNVKKLKPTEENIIASGGDATDKLDTPSVVDMITVKTEPIEIKIEPANNDSDADDDDNTSRTYADLSNFQQMSGTNFQVNESFYAVPGVDFVKMATTPTSFDQNLTEPLSKFSEFAYLPPLEPSHPCDTTDPATVDSTILNNSQLLDGIVLDAPKNEPLEQTFPSICDADFDEDDKIDIQLQNIVGNMNEFLGFNSNLSFLTTVNDETINMQSILEPPVIDELCPLPLSTMDSVKELNDVVDEIDESKHSIEVPYASNFLNSITNVQSPKPKNPLLAFRKPKKFTDMTATDFGEPNNGLTIDSISPENRSPLKTFSFDTNDWMCLSSAHDNTVVNESMNEQLSLHGQNDLSTCNTSKDLSNDQVSDILRLF